ncbi:MAG: acyl-[acyl-carrier-protein] thioesterase [Thermoplasmatota archaeon]
MFAKEMGLKVRTYECGAEGRLSIRSLMHHMQEAASLHANEMGLGEEWLQRNDYLWVLVDLKVGIDRLPVWKEEAVIYTWPSGFDDYRAFREFSIAGPGGREIARASSNWMVLSVEEKLPVKLSRTGIDLPRSSKRHFPGLGRLITKGEGERVMTIEVPYSSLDGNGHVNNTEYVRWGIDAASKAKVRLNDIGTLHISYTAEVFEGNIVDLFILEKDEKVLITGKREEDGRKVFLLELVLKE